MDERIVFAIEIAASVGADLLRVDGRAYRDVRLGDNVYITDHAATLVVVDIVTYGHHVPELNRGLTGTLYLRSAFQADELGGSYLFHADNQQWVEPQ
jgi:hypothetical protein